VHGALRRAARGRSPGLSYRGDRGAGEPGSRGDGQVELAAGFRSSIPPAPLPPRERRARHHQQVPAPPLRFGDQWTVRVAVADPPETNAWQGGSVWEFAVVGASSEQVIVEARPSGSRDSAPVTLVLDPASGGLVRSRVVVPSNYGPKMIDRQHAPDRPQRV